MIKQNTGKLFCQGIPLNPNISRLNYSIWELHALFQRWDLQSQLQFSTEERKNRRFNGNSAEINSVKKHRFRVKYQSWKNISIKKCRVPVSFRFDFGSELMLIFQALKYCHSNSFSLKRSEESQYMFYRSIAFITYVFIKKSALYLKMCSHILRRT